MTLQRPFLRRGRFSVVFLSHIVLFPSALFLQAGVENQELTLHWRKDILTIQSSKVPGGKIEVWYLEAICRKGAHEREWSETTLPHRTEWVDRNAEGSWLTLRTNARPGIEILHEITAGTDEVDFRLTVKNLLSEHVDAEWAQPCIRVATFTGLDQEHYIRRCFIPTENGFQRLNELPRALEARYRGGQVYVSQGVPHQDVNPRPISPVVPRYPLIGCFSENENLLIATAWSRTEELFQGVITCIHSDFRIGGLGPKETKHIHGKIYLMENDLDRLLARYRKDFKGASLPHTD